MSYDGFHIGIVVQNDDPNFGGRVKVFVPEHAPNIDKLNRYIREGREIKFNAIDKDLSPELVEILDDLKEALPWAEYAGPIFGGSSDGRFRCATKDTSTNDDVNFGKYGSIDGWREANKFMGSSAPKDDFGISNGNTIPIANENTKSYEPANYSGMPRGVFSIPNVGAQVYVFYIENDPAYPVYFAAAYNPDAIKKIYTLGKSSDDSTNEFEIYDYPNDFENSNEETEDSKIFRSKTVLNSNKHTIEMIDTDGDESMRLQHYGGAFMQFTNYGTKKFSPGNDQNLVYGNGFTTVKGNFGLSVGGDTTTKFHGNYHTMIGDYTDVRENTLPVLKALDELGDIKRLFNVRRTSSAYPPQDTSTKQKKQAVKGSGKSKGYVTCPTCGGKTYDPYHVNGLNIGGTYFDENTDEGMAEKIAYMKIHVISPEGETIDENTSGFVKSKNKVQEDIDYGWSRIPRAKYYCSNEFVTPPPYFSKEYLSGIKTSSESEDVTSETVTRLETMLGQPHEQHGEFGKVGIFGGVKCPTCNNELWTKSRQTSAWAEKDETGNPSPLSGYSPSTENGHWRPETALQSALGLKIVEKFKEVSNNLAAIGEGGDRVDTITMSKVETIGTVFNDLPSFRVDPIGKLRLDGLFVTQQSTVPYYLPTPHVEPVDVTSVPGGDYNLTIGNKWNVNVGSQGISIKTTGGLQIGGAISTIAVQELNLSAKHDMIIDGGERLMIRARKVTVNPVEHNALSIDGQLHVLRNMIVRGGALIEGELALFHVTAPGELALTGPEIWMGSDEETCEVSTTIKLGAELESPDIFGGRHDQSDGGYRRTVLIGAGIGTVLAGPIGTVVGGLFGRHHYKNRRQDQDISGLQEAMQSIAAFLSGEIAAVIKLPYHEHSFLQIPTTFKDCPNAVRAELLGSQNNINSRQIIVAAKRRHHIGAMEACEDAAAVYEKNKEYFDGLIWDAIVKDVVGLEISLVEKGLKKGVNPNSAADFRTYALLAFSGCNGNNGVLYFYSIKEYYKVAKTPADMSLGNLMSSSKIVRIQFEFAKESDDSSMGDSDETHTTSVTTTNHYSEEDLRKGFVSGSETVGLVSDGIAGSQVNSNKEQNLALLEVWVGKFTSSPV